MDDFYSHDIILKSGIYTADHDQLLNLTVEEYQIRFSASLSEDPTITNDNAFPQRIYTRDSLLSAEYFNGEGRIRFNGNEEVYFTAAPDYPGDNTELSTETAVNAINRMLKSSFLKSIGENSFPHIIESLEKFFDGVQAHNIAYWQMQAWCHPGNEKHTYRNSFDTENNIKACKEFFIRGIIEYMLTNADEKKSNYPLLLQSLEILQDIPSIQRDAELFVQEHMLNLIIHETIVDETLHNTIKCLEEDLYKAMLRFESKDLFVMFRHLISGYITDDITAASESFKDLGDDPYYYEYFGDNLVRQSRLLFLLNNNQQAHIIAEAAKGCYEIIQHRLLQNLNRSNDASMFHENKLLFYSQACFLENITSIILKKKTINIDQAVSQIEKFLIDFYNTSLNPLDKRVSTLGLIEEMEWALLYNQFASHFLGKRSDGLQMIFEKYLG